MMIRNVVTSLTTCMVLAVTVLAGCDSEATEDKQYSGELRALPVDDNAELSANVGCTGFEMPQLMVPNFSSIEVFMFSLQPDAFALTSATGGLLAPFPSTIDTFDEPEISEGAFVGTKVLDRCGNLIGFGSEQQLLDTQTALADTTYTITLPDRGTMLASQEENFAPIFGEINDMVANQEFVRSYSPPLTVVTTSFGSGELLGGTGEFADQKGFMIEINFISEINLLDGSADILDVLLVGYE